MKKIILLQEVVLLENLFLKNFKHKTLYIIIISIKKNYFKVISNFKNKKLVEKPSIIFHFAAMANQFK